MRSCRIHKLENHVPTKLFQRLKSSSFRSVLVFVLVFLSSFMSYTHFFSLFWLLLVVFRLASAVICVFGKITAHQEADSIITHINRTRYHGYILRCTYISILWSRSVYGMTWCGFYFFVSRFLIVCFPLCVFGYFVDTLSVPSISFRRETRGTVWPSTEIEKEDAMERCTNNFSQRNIYNGRRREREKKEKDRKKRKREREKKKQTSKKCFWFTGLRWKKWWWELIAHMHKECTYKTQTKRKKMYLFRLCALPFQIVLSVDHLSTAGSDRAEDEKLKK